MERKLNQVHILSILYDLVLVTGSETRSEILIEKFLQRLMFHTGIPVGLFIEHIHTDPDTGLLTAHISCVIGDPVLAARPNKTLKLCCSALKNETGLIQDCSKLNNCFGTEILWRSGACLHVSDTSKFILLSPESTLQDLPWQEGFRPVLNNFASMLALCRENEARTNSLASAIKELEAFSYSVSHDLRAPLRAVDGFSQALLEDCAEQLNDTGKDYLNRIRQATQHMSTLIDDLLKLSRVTRQSLQPSEVNLSTMAHSIITNLQIENPDHHAHTNIADDMITMGDPGLMQIMLENLLNNAWKYSSKTQDARISFDAEQHNGKRVFRIQDNGAGFDMKYADKLFGVFQRLHAKNEFEGTGIGLATVQRIIHRHGGAIWANAEPDKGATFYFTLN